MTANTDLRLARYFEMFEGFFLERKRQIAAALEIDPAPRGMIWIAPPPVWPRAATAHGARG